VIEKARFSDGSPEMAFNEFLPAWKRVIGLRLNGVAKAAQHHLQDARCLPAG